MNLSGSVVTISKLDLRGPLQIGAKQINAMMAAPNSIDVAHLSDAIQKAAVVTSNWTQVCKFTARSAPLL
jgi:hypothetical protein